MGSAGEARAAAENCGFGMGKAGEARAAAVNCGFGMGKAGEVAEKAVEVVARNVARTKRDFNEIKDMAALLPWAKLFELVTL
jgi:hypothetical protein